MGMPAGEPGDTAQGDTESRFFAGATVEILPGLLHPRSEPIKE